MTTSTRAHSSSLACITALVVGCAGSDAGAPSTSGGSSTSSTSEPPSPTTAAEDPPTTGAAPTTGMTGGSSGPAEDGSAGEATGADPAVCGDGQVQEGEACDEGFADNQDDQPCTSQCQLAVCGDGHVQPAVGEACDDGPLNQAAPGYGQCSQTCARGPFCGDGTVQAADGEQCEPGESDEFDNCAPGCVFKPRLLFLTSQAYTGAMGGISGADAACNELASAVPGMSGTFRAWLLVDGQGLTARFPEFSQLQTAWNFTGTDGTVLAYSLQELIEAGPMHPLVHDEYGDSRPERWVWTNITSDGNPAGGDCAQWTATTGKALVGHSGFDPDVGPDAVQWHADHWWTDLAGLQFPCDNANVHLYCIQVAD